MRRTEYMKREFEGGTQYGFYDPDAHAAVFVGAVWSDRTDAVDHDIDHAPARCKGGWWAWDETYVTGTGQPVAAKNIPRPAMRAASTVWINAEDDREREEREAKDIAEWEADRDRSLADLEAKLGKSASQLNLEEDPAYMAWLEQW